ncbi:MAG: DEAD/DEAH box helicase [Candidatus Woesearchaeota archaeon]
MEEYKDKIPSHIFSLLKAKGFESLRPSQEKSIKAGLFENKNLLVCTPTASGKTLVGELAMLNACYKGKKAVYVVPLKALASEKYKQFSKYDFLKVGVGSGDIDSEDKYLNYSDIIVVTSEKLDSLIRHKASFIKEIGVLVVDEIHLLNDASRGPTLEVVITMLKDLLNPQIIGLSATIGNPDELASWLNASLVEDSWRPVELKRGTFLKKIEFLE